jgi:hypothetical protein
VTDKDLSIGDTVNTKSGNIRINHVTGNSFITMFDITCRKRRTEAFVYVRADVSAASELSSVVQGVFEDFGGDIEEVRS